MVFFKYASNRADWQSVQNGENGVIRSNYTVDNEPGRLL
jgi:hypothetical protein